MIGCIGKVSKDQLPTQNAAVLDQKEVPVSGHEESFFTQTELIEPVSPQAAQLSIHFLYK